ncbi:MAG: hypothetical protein H6577_19500 [Lewinellaceae bacterium]|nr:hypothetical protein [Saprospiraceae bacterium]MCB9340313.1 hypothetical protein [Lewinellaceae bacterium]
MRSLKIFLSIAMGMWIFATSAYAYYDPKQQAVKNPDKNAIKFREACTTAKKQIDQDVNNVRARLTTGGDVWWDRSDGKYIVPKVDPGQKEVSSIFAGAVWLGGLDKGGGLKVACQTYGNGSNASDFWSGPLRDGDGTTTKELCDQWDKFFEVSGEEIRVSRAFYFAAQEGTGAYTEDMIPEGVKGWPAEGNPYFFDVHKFDLPKTEQGLAGYKDVNLDGIYDPLDGDFPIIEIRGCEEKEAQFPDEMIFWIYNDEGGGALHRETNGTAIRMEVQVQAFGYATNDQINDMTFQRYKLINRALEDIDSTYFAMWVDADLGCYLDDYIGCDIDRSLAYTYNADAEDGQPGITCPGGVQTYGTEVPIIGIDYFRGPLNEFRQELGMSSFTYFNNPSVGSPAPPNGTTDPSTDVEFYNYLSGRWKDGTRYTFGGDGYNPTSTDYINYAFTGNPNEDGKWSMCNPQSPNFPNGLPEYDRRTVQASGPFTLQPGAVNELIIGAVWVPNLNYPCPNISSLQLADDISQALFDNCFDILDGPDAPDVDWIELDRELIAVLSNKPNVELSNNAFEAYQERGPKIPSPLPGEEIDTLYRFEGYLLYQLANPNVSVTEFGDPTKARLIYSVDKKNGIGTIYNWKSVPNPNYDPGNPADKQDVYYPELTVEGLDNGIRHTFSITQDQFATGDRNLLNHRKYYFSAKAYAYNNYKPFDPLRQEGQETPYIEGRGNIRVYNPIPRPILDRVVNAEYGEGPVVTRIDGIGVGAKFIDMSLDTRARILDGSFNGEIVYNPGAGPIDVVIFNPLENVDGEFEVTFFDEKMTNENPPKLDDSVRWQFRDLNNPNSTIISERTIDELNEQILAEYGFSISIGQTDDVGDWVDPSDGAIGYSQSYAAQNKPIWFSAIPNNYPIATGLTSNAFNYVVHKPAWEDRAHEVLATIGQGFFVPYQIVDISTRLDPVAANNYYITPGWRSSAGLQVQKEDFIQRLNNVDIVMTSDKSLWSRCVVIETASTDYTLNADAQNETGGRVTTDSLITVESNGTVTKKEIKQFDVRPARSVSKEDSDGDGLPDIDPIIPGVTKMDSLGMGWFPGYAIDVETGQRLNIFFGENSVYSKENGFLSSYVNGVPNGRDMIFNPNSQVLLPIPDGVFNPMLYYAGGQHFIYVTNEPYDSCAMLRERLDVNQATPFRKVSELQRVTWTCLPILNPGTRLLSYAEGLIPNDITIKLRVDNPYAVSKDDAGNDTGTGDFNGYPTYRFKFEGKAHSELDEAGIKTALDMINVVPNPYYAYSQYEISRSSTIVKITNLPAKCVVTIYSLDGKFIRRYNRDEVPGAAIGDGIPSAQVIPDLEWDLKNSKGIPVSAGVYLIHVDAPGYGERTLKWFGISRQFDPTGL